MKILKKSYIGKRDQKNRVYEERNILESMNNQFVVQMNYAFQDKGKLFFILEFCPGGELYNILSKKRKFNEE
jgi:serum/glucocorticoid-regulated kinase 2